MNALKHFRISLCMICLALFMCSCNKPVEVQISEQLDLGHKYLTEQNYEQAVIAFNKAIELDEKNFAAYEGAVRAYEAMGRKEDAVAIAERGLKVSVASEEEKSYVIESLFAYYKSKAEFCIAHNDEKNALEYYQKASRIQNDEETRNQIKLIEDIIIKRENQKSNEELLKIVGIAAGQDNQDNYPVYTPAVDYDGDGLEDLFVEFVQDDNDSPHKSYTVYYVDSQGEDCQKVLEYELDRPIPNDLWIDAALTIEIDDTAYWATVHGSDYGGGRYPQTIKAYYVFGVRNGSAEIVASGNEISIEDLEAGNIVIN